MKRGLIGAGLAWLAIVVASAQSGPARRAPPPPAENAAMYGALSYRDAGPPGRRTDAVAGVPGDPWTYYAGSATSGIFKTTDGGAHWTPILASPTVPSITALAVAPSDSNIVWAGAGGPHVRGQAPRTEGLFRSTDAGRTWSRVGLGDAGRIARVVIDPANPEVVFACARGTGGGHKLAGGVFRTSDGGVHWERVLFIDNRTGCSDIALDPSNSKVLYAGTWQLGSRWRRTNAGPGGGIYKSRDGGLTWSRLSGGGLPAATLETIGVSVARSDPDRVYALIATGRVTARGDAAPAGQLWISPDGGNHWRAVRADGAVYSGAADDTGIAVSPTNEDELTFLGTRLTHSLDGGRSLTSVGNSPGDGTHDLWIDPTDADRMIVADDGGVSLSVTHGRVWTRADLPIGGTDRASQRAPGPYPACLPRADTRTPPRRTAPPPEIARRRHRDGEAAPESAQPHACRRGETVVAFRPFRRGASTSPPPVE